MRKRECKIGMKVRDSELPKMGVGEVVMTRKDFVDVRFPRNENGVSGKNFLSYGTKGEMAFLRRV